MEYDVFLSYSHQDIDMMQRIRDDLQKAGLHVWNDEQLIPGTPSWKSTIQHTIENTAIVLVILSPNAKKSEWVERELDYATTYGTRVIPVLAQGTERESIPLELINKQWVDLRADYATGLQHLIAAVQTDLPAINMASSATPPSATLGSKIVSTPTALDPWNPMDQLRLSLWLFWMPDQLYGTRHNLIAEPIWKTGAWLVSTLSWLTIAIPTLAYSVGTIPRMTPNSGVLLASWVLIILGWLITGWLTGRREQQAGILSFAITAIFILAVSYLMGQVVGIEFAVNVIERAALLAAVGIAFGVSVVVNRNAIGIVGGILVGMVLYTGMFNIGVGLDASIAGIALIGMAILVGFTLRRGIESGQRSRLNWITLAASGLTYVVLLWLYFLGGWGLLK